MPETGSLFDDATLAPVELEAPPEILGGPSLRCVYWGDDAAVCLVRCDGGERNIKTVRKLATICGTSCADAKSTSGIPPAKLRYCQTCVVGSGTGVLR